MLSTAAKNEALDGVVADKLSLHSGDPGASGTANEISGGGYARQAATFAAAASGERILSAAVDFTGPASQSVTWVGLWAAGTPDVFKGRAQITSGDLAFNAAGEYRLTTGTKIIASDPA